MVIDPDLFIHLKITPHQSIFYFSVFGNILMVARGMIPDKNKVLDSGVLVMIVQYSHFLPDK